MEDRPRIQPSTPPVSQTAYDLGGGHVSSTKPCREKPRHAAETRKNGHSTGTIDTSSIEPRRWLEPSRGVADCVGVDMTQVICDVNGCDRQGRLVRGLCQGHYSRWLRHGDVQADIPLRPSRIPEGAMCAVDDCDKPVHLRSWCETHYGRWARNGDPLVHKRPDLGKTLADRFWSKVDRNGPLGCWLWTASLDSKGYGQFIVMRGERGYPERAHRMAWEFLRGPVPEGLVLDHLCRTRHCVNPDHLEAVTNKQNILRGVAFSAIHARKTHCKHGHAFTPENTYRPPRGGRQCIACNKRREAARRAK